MPDSSRPLFDQAATLDELAGRGKNRRFDEVIDDEEVETIQVICKRGDDESRLLVSAAHSISAIATSTTKRQSDFIKQRRLGGFVEKVTGVGKLMLFLDRSQQEKDAY